MRILARSILRAALPSVQGQGRCLGTSDPKPASKYHSRVGVGIRNRFASLPSAKDKYFQTYIWIDGTGVRTRSKLKIVDKEADRVEDVDLWHYDGSSTKQATGENSDMVLHPRFMTRDPFLGQQHRLVLCEVLDRHGDPALHNHRSQCLEIYNQVRDRKPWFGMEQEYTLISGRTGKPLGWPEEGFPPPQGPYYCAHGAQHVYGRDIAESHMLACLHADLFHAGTNAEVMPGQWEYQIGPCGGIDMGDHLWMARHLMERICEEFDADVTLDPKPVAGDWNGAGNHCNFSTKEMREEGGLKVIEDAMPLLEKAHQKHIEVYDPSGGEDNRRRLTGMHETASIHDFSWGVGNRAVSIRIPRPVAEQGKGWFEDRRPSANCDPYQVVRRILKTVVLKDTN